MSVIDKWWRWRNRKIINEILHMGVPLHPHVYEKLTGKKLPKAEPIGDTIIGLLRSEASEADPFIKGAAKIMFPSTFNCMTCGRDRAIGQLCDDTCPGMDQSDPDY